MPTNFAVVVQQIGCPHDQRNGSLVGRLKLSNSFATGFHSLRLLHGRHGPISGHRPISGHTEWFPNSGEKWHQCPTVLEELHASIQSHMALVQSSSRPRSLVNKPNCLSFSVLDYNDYNYNVSYIITEYLVVLRMYIIRITFTDYNDYNFTTMMPQIP